MGHHKQLQMLAHGGAMALALAIGPAARAAEVPVEAAPETTEPTAEAAPEAAAPLPVDDSAGIEEIIVTATKRAQSISEVPMSISAFSGEQLAEKGVADVADLQKIVSGFRYSEGNNGTPIYSIRGVGFNETSLGALANVPVYVDEAPVPFPIMSGGVAMDLERVEVLKGPQGTLFGQNATGGAVNYIAAKPTDQFSSALTLGYGRFQEQTIEGYVSGPLAAGIRGRLAVKAQNSGPWQKSASRDDELGRKNELNARALFDWQASEALKLTLTLSARRDKSDPQALQYSGYRYQLQPAADLDILPVAEQEAVENTPTSRDNRKADWGPRNPRNDAHQQQAALRGDYATGDDSTLTYLGSYAHFKRSMYADPDGLPIENSEGESDGEIDAHSHELRWSGRSFERLQWLVGLNYSNGQVDQYDIIRLGQNSNSYGLVLAPAQQGFPPNPAFHFSAANNDSEQKFVNKAVFAALDYDLSQQFRAHLAARHTKATDDFRGCTTDAGDGVTAAAINGVFGSAIAPGGCITGVADSLATSGTITPQPEYLKRKLDEDNNTWRVGLDYKPADGTLFYVSLSKGYKGGSFPNLSAFSQQQYQPVVQESLLATELGFKTIFREQQLQIDGAVFHYDYKNKQVRGSLDTGVPFGVLPSLINVPKSEQLGAETQLVWRPAAGWTTSLSAVYIDSEIKGDFTSYDDFGGVSNFGGQTLPNTPEWQANADVQYAWSLASGYVPFVGVNAHYEGETYNGFGEDEALKIDSYTLVDLRAGTDSADGRWRATLWVRNLTDEYYWLNQLRIGDTITKVVGMPRTYGVGFTYRFQ